jgi:Phasin protein
MKPQRPEQPAKVSTIRWRWARRPSATFRRGLRRPLENVRDLNLRLIDMAQANTQAAFDFAREVAEAKGPSDCVQAWTTNATKQFDMLTKQASELTRLCQGFANAMPGLKGR